MGIDELKHEVQKLGAHEWAEFLGWVVSDEKDRRAAQPAVEQARAAGTQKLWEAYPELKPDFKTKPVEVGTDKAFTLEDLLASYPAWKQPQGAHDALPTGAIVSHNGEIWRTDLPTLNVWPPEENNPHTRWVKITDQLLAEYNPPEVDDQDAEPETSETPAPPETEETAEQPTAPAYRNPSGAHDAYKQGDRVTYNGAVYESTINGNVWAPDAYPAGWKKL